MKPAVFTPYRLSDETHTSLLWVFEGITSYYDDLALVRSGLITLESYLELLGQTITSVLRSVGRLRQSVADSSFDAWTKLYKRDANASNAIISYYTKGSLIALTLDLKLRSDSDGRISLDDVMKECWSRWGQSGDGMPEDGFESVCSEVSGLDLADFFDATVRGTGELPMQSILASFGIDFHLRATTSRTDEGGKPAEDNEPPSPWLGASLADTSGKPTFAAVYNGGPAEAAGVAPGDVAVALDGFALTLSNCDLRLKTYQEGDNLELVIFRGDELITTTVQLAPRPENTCYLQVSTDCDAATETRRNDWLHMS